MADSKIIIKNKGIAEYLNNAANEANEIEQKSRIVSEFDNSFNGINKKISTLLVSAETIGLNYDVFNNRCELYSKVGNYVSTDYFDISGDEYDDLCDRFKIDLKSLYNYSGWIESEAGDLIRVFATTAPITKHPCVTLNISRKPIGDIQQKELIPLIPKIFTDNFIIVGATGSGKTYLLNNCLQLAFRESANRIFLIEEFHELFKPNKHTCCLDVPSAKPGEIPIFDHVIAQTNLMRCQNIFVGEIKGKEAWPFVLNLASGTHGGCTMHGSSCEDGLSRLQMLMATAGICDRETCGTLISRSIRYVIYVEKHVVKDIKRVTGVYNPTTNKYQFENIL